VNCGPGEVEAVLHDFPGIRRAAVVGRKQEDGNEEVLAFVETDDNCPLDLPQAPRAGGAARQLADDTRRQGAQAQPA